MIKKLKSKSGETLMEILVAILILALSAGLFAALYSAAMQIDVTAREEDDKMFAAVGELEDMIESGSSESTGTVYYTPVDEDGNEKASSGSDVGVDLFTKDGMTTYKESATSKESATPAPAPAPGTEGGQG